MRLAIQAALLMRRPARLSIEYSSCDPKLSLCTHPWSRIPQWHCLPMCLSCWRPMDRVEHMCAASYLEVLPQSSVNLAYIQHDKAAAGSVLALLLLLHAKPSSSAAAAALREPGLRCNMLPVRGFQLLHRSVRVSSIRRPTPCKQAIAKTS
jgi:hypothetical protein